MFWLCHIETVNMNSIDTSYGQVELHLNNRPEFVRRFGRKVKACGGHYSACRILGNPRIVVVPASETALIDAMAAAFPDGKKACLIARKYTDSRVERAPSWVHVHNYLLGCGTPASQWLAGQVRSAIAQAVRRNIIETKPKQSPPAPAPVPSVCTVVHETLSDGSVVFNVRLDLDMVHAVDHRRACDFAQTFNAAVAAAQGQV